MPELPEVETVRAGLADHVLGRTVAAVELPSARALRRTVGGAPWMRDHLVGTSLAAAVRRGKFLWLTLADDPDHALLVHLGMSGQLLVRADPEPVVKHLGARLRFEDGGALDFVDQRTFGYVALDPLVATADGGPGGFAGDPQVGAGSATAATIPTQVAHIARDLLDPALDRAALVRRLRTRRTGVKRALLDQTLVSGVGNIYADEALWRAKVHPERALTRLAPATIRRVLDAATEVMTTALAQGGTSFDALYVNVNGASGYFDRSLAVYGQQGRPCPRCGTPVQRLAFANRSSHVCPRCQRAG